MLLLLVSFIYIINIPTMVKKTQMRELSYGKFYSMLTSGKVEQATRVQNIVSGTLKNGQKYRVYVDPTDVELGRVLRSSVPQYDVQPKNNFWPNLLFSLGPMLLFILFLWFFVYRNMSSNGNKIFSFGKSQATRGDSQKKVTFSDVAGVDEAIEELCEVVGFLKNPKKYEALGGRIPKGVLLVGEPGTGKTLLAKAVAGEAGVPFFSISASDFCEMFVGVGAARVRDLFQKARMASEKEGKGGDCFCR